MKISVSLCAIIFAQFLPSFSYAQCNQAALSLDEAKRESSPDRKLAILEQVPAECRDYAITNAIGEALAQKRDYIRAYAVLDDALDRAKNADERAEAYSNLGVVALQQNKLEEAAQYFLNSRKERPSPELEKQLLALEKRRAETVVSAKSITEALAPSPQKSKSLSRGFTVEPSIDLRVQFVTNSFKLTPEGRKQADEIAKAMKQDDLKEKTFKIIGHTDLRGSYEYNEHLSKKRAVALCDYLIKKRGIDGKRLKTLGKGKREPLFSEIDDTVQALNRRVQIEVTK